MMEILNKIFEDKKRGNPMPLAVRNAEYHLCMDDQNALLFLLTDTTAKVPFYLRLQ